MCLTSWRNFYQLISIGSMYMSSACAVFQTSVIRLDRYLRAWAWTPSTHINIYSMHTPSFCADCRAQMGVCFLAHLFMSSCSSIATSQFLHFCLLRPCWRCTHRGGVLARSHFVFMYLLLFLGQANSAQRLPTFTVFRDTFTVKKRLLICWKNSNKSGH